MGVAIIIPNADFSANNLGKVTLLQDINVTGLTINCNDTYSDVSFTPTVGYTPSNTSKRGVTWKITSGGTYATIDANTGVVTILSGASNSSITIVATSTSDSTIIATKVVTVTYYVNVNVLTSLSVKGETSVNGKTSQYSVGYTPSNTALTGVTWSITSGGTYATIDASTGLLTVASTASNSSINIRATSTHDSSIYADLSVTVTYSAYTPILNIFDSVASDVFGGSGLGYILLNTNVIGKTVNYFRLHVASDSPSGVTVKIYKCTGLPADYSAASVTFLGYFAILSTDLGQIVAKSITPFTLSNGEYLLINSTDGVKWYGNKSDTKNNYLPYVQSTGKVTTSTTGNVNIEPMT